MMIMMIFFRFLLSFSEKKADDIVSPEVEVSLFIFIVWNNTMKMTKRFKMK